MRKLTFILVSLLLIFCLSCKKKEVEPRDITPPTVVIGGDSPYYLVVESFYEDLGANAYDDIDWKTINSSITIAHNVPGLPAYPQTAEELKGYVTSIGTYKITYTATDNAGNVGKTDRSVIITNDIDKYAINYYIAKISLFTITADYSDLQLKVLPDSNVNNRINFPRLSNISGLKIDADIANQTDTNGYIKKMITIPTQYKEAGGFIYKIFGFADECYFIDTLWYEMRIKYQIEKYENNNGSPGTFVNYDLVIETYERM